MNMVRTSRLDPRDSVTMIDERWDVTTSQGGWGGSVPVQSPLELWAPARAADSQQGKPKVALSGPFRKQVTHNKAAYRKIKALSELQNTLFSLERTLSDLMAT